MKKLLFINSRFLPLIGGGETYTLELMKHFSAQGWEVHLATQERGFNGSTWNGCFIHYLEGFDDNDHRILLCAPALRKILRTVKPDLIHVHNIMPYFALSSITEVDEYPLVLTIHNTPLLPDRIFGGFKDFEAEAIFTRQLLANNKYHKLLVGSHYYLDSYAEVAPWLKTEGKATVAYYFPPDITTGPLIAKPSKGEHEPINLLFPSRILKRKGIEQCLLALSALPTRFSLSLPAFASCEDVEYQQYIKKLINDHGIAERVILSQSPTTPEKMVDYYKKADIVIIPSHYEGFGIVAVEAMSWGIPVIASDTSGLAEIVKHGINGLLVPPKNARAIEEAVLRISGNATLTQRLVDNGIAMVHQKFNRQKHMQQIELLYKQALNGATSKNNLSYGTKTLENARA